MIQVSCSYERLNDGSYLLTPDVLGSFSSTAPIVLAGPQAHLWEILIEITKLGNDAQHMLFSQLNREVTGQIFTVIDALGRANCLSLHDTIYFNTAELPRIPRLNKIHLEITHRCNFKCRACYLGDHLRPMSGPKSDEGTTGQWVRLIEEARELGCTDATVTGGDPFARSDALIILTALSENGISSEINTNASFITSKVARELGTLRVSAVAVTIYGYNETSTSLYTGNRSGYRAAFRGIRCLVEENIPVVVKYFATSDNAEGFELVSEEIGRLGVPVRFMGREIHGDLFTGTSPAEGLVRAEVSKPIVLQENALPCYPSIHAIGIAPDGMVRGCPKLTIYFGNAFTHGLGYIWQKSTALSAFREFWSEYCKHTGYVAGIRVGSLCPASDILSQENGLAEFKKLWSHWEKEGNIS